MPTEEQKSRVIYYALALRDAAQEDQKNATKETKEKFEEAWDSFLDSLEIYEHGNLDLTSRNIVFEANF